MQSATSRYERAGAAWTPLEAALRRTADLSTGVAAILLLALWTGLIALDALTGPHMSLNGFYLVPLCFTTWCLGRVAGLTCGAIAVACTLYLNGFGDGLSAQASSVPVAVAIWNAGMRAFAVVFVILFVGAFRRTFDRERENARADPLTGLGNRRSFKSESKRLQLGNLRDNRVILCGLIDVDDFKQINDQHGHAAGDEVLKTVARSLFAAVRPYDVIARFGGDEFAFCLAVRDETAAERKAGEIHEAISAALQTSQYRVTCSLGSATGHDVEGVLIRADAAMYHAKRTKKGTWNFKSKAWSDPIATTP